MATDRENRVAGADQYERGSSVPVSRAFSLSLSLPSLYENPLPAVAPSPLRVSEGNPSRAYAPFRARKSGSYIYASTSVRVNGDGEFQSCDEGDARGVYQCEKNECTHVYAGTNEGLRRNDDTCFRDAALKNGSRQVYSYLIIVFLLILFGESTNHISLSLSLFCILRESFRRALEPSIP